MADRATGTRPAAEGWTTHIPATLRKTKMSEYLHRGQSRVAGHTPVDEGAGFTVKARQSKTDRELGKTRETLRARFEGRSINEASLDDKEFIDTTTYDFSFDPSDSSMITKLEYSSRSRLLRVTFVNNGAVTVYAGVPMNVYARLQYVEESGNSVGGAFWDLIRIYERRGLPVGGPYYPKSSNFVRDGSKYPFIYSEEGISLGERASEYNTEDMVLSDGTVKRGTKSEAMAPYYQELAKGADSAIYLEPKEFKKALTQLKNMKNPQLREKLLRQLHAADAEGKLTDAERKRQMGTVSGADFGEGGGMNIDSTKVRAHERYERDKKFGPGSPTRRN